MNSFYILYFLISIFAGTLSGWLGGLLTKYRIFSKKIGYFIFGAVIGLVLYVFLRSVIAGFRIFEINILCILLPIILLLVIDKIKRRKNLSVKSHVTYENNLTNKTTVRSTNEKDIRSEESITHNQKELVDRMQLSKNNIFISYRRDDSSDVTGRIYDRLALKFGPDFVFKDVDSIPLGVNFKQYIDKIIQKCNILLVVIGDNWLEVKDGSGKPRIQDPKDHVRLEIEAGLKRSIPIIPILVKNAQLPSQDDIPESMIEIIYYNGIAVRPDPDFHHDVDRLIKGIESYTNIS